MAKFNRKLTIVLAYAGALLALAALLIFKILPTSELANGIQYSGTDALWVLVTCPVLAVLGAVCFMSSFLKDSKIWQSYLSEPVLMGATIACGIVLAINLYVYFSYTIDQFSLGFVAPYAGTKYETYDIFVTVMTINQFILSTIAALAVKRSKSLA
jgi:hypothetical protein